MAVDFDQGIAEQQAALRRRAVFGNRGHQRAVRIGQRQRLGLCFGQGHGLRAHAEPGARDPAIGEQLIDHSIHGRSWNCDSVAARQRRRADADRTAVGADDRRAGKTCRECAVQPQHSIDPATAPCLPRIAGARDQSVIDSYVIARVARHGHDPVPGLDGCRVAARQRRRIEIVDAQRRQVG